MKEVALITGASTGIGRELALIHAERTGDLVIIARNIDKLNSLKTQIENKYKRSVLVIAKDLSQMTSANEIFEEIKSKNIQVDYLMNNAGFGGHGLFHERTMQSDLDMIQVNITTLTALTKLFLPEMVQRNSGKILNTSSTASLLPGPLQAVYFATKAYVTFLSNALSEELRNTNITVTNLMPGATETEFAKTSGMDKTDLFKKTVSAHSVALEGYDGMMAGKLDVISGLSFGNKIMMKLAGFIPKKVALKQIRQMQEVTN